MGNTAEVRPRHNPFVSGEKQIENEAKARAVIIKAMELAHIKDAADNWTSAMEFFLKGKLTEENLIEAKKNLGIHGDLSFLVTFTVPNSGMEINGLWQEYATGKRKIGDRRRRTQKSL